MLINLYRGPWKIRPEWQIPRNNSELGSKIKKKKKKKEILSVSKQKDFHGQEKLD